MAPVCRFWQKGYCKNGDRCAFEHPAKFGQPVHSQNRFGVLDPRSQVPDNRGSRPNDRLPYQLDKGVITSDLSRDRPIWILSSYGPGRDAPIQLFGGLPREQSFEEMRVRHYELATLGNQQQAILEAQELVSNAEQQMQSALNDVDGAINYIISGEKQHPNRIDICKAKVATTGQSSTPNPTLQAPTTFGQPSLPQAPTPSTFGQPSTFGRPSTSFGQPSQPVASFGQTTTFGKPASTFGQQTPAFGQPAPMGRTVTAFGQPTGTFGQSSAPASTFGQPSNPPAFGKPSNPEAPRTFASQPVPAFPTSTSTFGQQNIPAASTPFGQQAAPPSDTFGQPSQPPPNPFGNPTAPTTTNPFDRPSQPSSSNPFSQPAAPHQPSPFGQTPPPPSNPFTQPPRPSTTDPSSSLPASSTTTKRDAQNKLTLWKGHPVRYIDGEPCRKRTDGAWEKIWFPDGPPKFAKTPELPDELYDEGTRERYLFMRQQGGFRDGVMPLLPPKREWCRWDF